MKKILVISLLLFFLNQGMTQNLSFAVWNGINASVNKVYTFAPKTTSPPTIKYPNGGLFLSVTNRDWCVKLGISSINKGVDIVNKSQNASGGERTVTKSISANEFALNFRFGKYVNTKNEKIFFLPFIGYDLRRIKHRNMAMIYVSNLILDDYIYHTNYSHCAILGCSVGRKFTNRHKVYFDLLGGYGLNKIITLDYLVYVNNQTYKPKVINYGHYFMASFGYEFTITHRTNKTSRTINIED